MEDSSPFMLRSVRVREDKKSQVPGVLHIDGSARPQTVTFDNGAFYTLLYRWFEETGVPMLLNTSFNGPDEPIVETPSDAAKAAKKLGIRHIYFPLKTGKVLQTLVR